MLPSAVRCSVMSVSPSRFGAGRELPVDQVIMDRRASLPVDPALLGEHRRDPLSRAQPGDPGDSVLCLGPVVSADHRRGGGITPRIATAALFTAPAWADSAGRPSPLGAPPPDRWAQRE